MWIEQNDAIAARYCENWLGVKFAQPMIGLLVMREPAYPGGAVIFNNWNARNVDMTAIGLGCWTVPVVRELARYAFMKLGVRRVSAQTRADNIKARMALRRMGFREEGAMRDWFDDGQTALLYGLTANEQRLFRS